MDIVVIAFKALISQFEVPLLGLKYAWRNWRNGRRSPALEGRDERREGSGARRYHHCLRQVQGCGDRSGSIWYWQGQRDDLYPASDRSLQAEEDAL